MRGQNAIWMGRWMSPWRQTCNGDLIMPVYEFQCSNCGVVEQMLSMAACDNASQCPHCSRVVYRIFATAPRLRAKGRDGVHAAQVNERAQHDPVRGSHAHAINELGRRQGNSSTSPHPAGCGCCKANATGTVTHADKSKSFPGRRPWMISH